MPDTASYTWVDHGELVVHAGPGLGSSYPLNETSTLIGYADDADVRIAHAAFAPRHCILLAVANGIHLRDLTGSEQPESPVLRDGDCFRVGDVEFKLRIPKPIDRDSATQEAWRVQVAAVAAQQAELDEREARLQEIHAQEERSLADRRRELDAKESHLSAVQADLDKAIQKLEIERTRTRDHAPDVVPLNAPHRRSDSPVPTSTSADWREQVLKLNTERELGNRRLQDGWSSLKLAQERWRTRRLRESAVLQVRRTDLEEGERRLSAARRQLKNEITTWNRKKLRLEEELFGLDQRIIGLRLAMRKTAEVRTPDAGDSSTPADWTARFRELDSIAGSLHDERLSLTEAWENLAKIQTQWETEREAILIDLEGWTRDVEVREGRLEERESQIAHREDDLGQREREFEDQRQGLAVWRTRLRQEQVDFQQEQELGREVLRGRTALLEKHWKEMVGLRDRWKQLRDHWQNETRVLSTKLTEDRKELQKLKLALNDRLAHVDEEKRLLREKSIAVEQFRVEVLMQSGDPTANDRLTAYRHEWNQQMVGILKQVQEARTSLRKELEILNDRKAECQELLVSAKGQELEVDERELAVSQLESQLRQVLARNEQEISDAGSQRRIAEQKVERLRDQLDRVTIGLFDDGEPPQRIDKAA